MKFEFSLGEASTSPENKIIISNNKLSTFDYLLFFDSRGLTINSEDKNASQLLQLTTYLHTHNLSYIAISRPKNLTIFATLYNFLTINTDIQFKSLITNLGFVDCTPKKQDNIDDILIQIKQFSTKNESILTHEEYQLADGSYEVLKTVLYSNTYIHTIANLLNEKFGKLYFINTPTIPNDTNFERKRPRAFFIQLEKTNVLIELIMKKIKKPAELIDIKNLDSTYDGVHFDKIGHEKIFTELKEKIRK